MSVEELRERSKAIWSTGDYEPTSRQLEPASVELVAALGIAEGHEVLDVASGLGNCAIAAARTGATVTATDFSPAMVEGGRRRTRATGPGIRWQQADAADLPFPDASFDRVTSVFGAIFAFDQERTAAEAVRVVRPGGRSGFTAWVSEGLTAQMLQIRARYGPPRPMDAPDPFRWGRADDVTAMFTALGCHVEVRPRTVEFRYASWEEWTQATEAHGAGVVARATMPPEEYAAMRREIQELTAAHNRGEGGAVVFDSDYLQVLVTKP